jgi:hypothetical protein
MKTSLALLPILTFSLTTTLHAKNASDGITFKVEELSKPTAVLRAEPATSIYEGLIRKDFETDSRRAAVDYGAAAGNTDYRYDIIAQSKIATPLVGYGYHPFFNAVFRAYSDHRPLVLSPDMVWLLISQGFAQHVNANAEKLRGRFVNFSGKVSLVVKTEHDMLNDPNAPWSEVFPDFTKQIAEHTGAPLMKTLTADFTTTTPAEAIASQITIMEAMKSYFEFMVMRVSCGIPEITLKGTPDDWQRVLDKTKSLASYDLAWWTSELEPLLSEFVKASRGDINRDFWKNIFKYHPAEHPYAPNIIDGWFVKFFPYDNVGHRNNLKQLQSCDNLPEEIVKVDVKYIDLATKITTPLEFWAGFVGLEQDEKSFTLTPKIGWMIRKKDVRNDAFRQQLAVSKTGSFDGSGEWISLRVNKVPPALFDMVEIDSLELLFTDKIVIPDELAQVKIRRLRLMGNKIDHAERAHIKKLFPNTEIEIKLFGQPEHAMTKNAMCISIIGPVLASLGFGLRRLRKKNWQLLAFGGTAMFVIALLSVKFGWRL